MATKTKSETKTTTTASSSSSASRRRGFSIGYILNILAYAAVCIGGLALFISMIIFTLNPSGFPEPVKKKGTAITPEQALILLNEKLELGIITEEEYKAQRAEIINNL